ncbi:UNVERIFIED_CONTAM: Ent-kaur-16-ene synthase, chloroplastic [Sesamum latifolium]|uniref:Ent-kaur-16-ene synthase, chloroplastic n=1 Tax=Sesamum latifolium TaxID=2727402 RepID=A0AAW2SN75_9LAMI
MMIDYANDLHLTLPFHQHFLDSMFSNRHSEIKRNRNLEYVTEGLGESFDWNKSLTQQRSNGSLFNSPATTAAAFIHTQDNNCFQYLH